MNHRAVIWKEDKIVHKDVCFECGSANEIHYHHIVPFSKGGRKTIPLCCDCHGKVHDRKFTNHKEMIIESLRKKKEAGEVLGRPVGTKETNENVINKYPEVVECYYKKMSIRQTKIKTKIAINTIHKVYKLLYKHDPLQGNNPII